MTTNKTPKTLNLHQKLLLISEGMGFLNFDKKNAGQGYGYASAAAVIRKLQSLLIEHKVTRRCINQRAEVLSGTDNKNNLITVHSVWDWVNAEDATESIQTCSVGQGKDPNDKGIGKATTNSNKYDIAHTLCLAWGAEDPDGSEPEEKAQRKPKMSTDATLEGIEACQGLKSLESLRGAVTELKGADKITAIAAFKARKAALAA